MQGHGGSSVPSVTRRHTALNGWTWSGDSLYGDGLSADVHLIHSVNSIAVFWYFKWI